MWGLGGSRPSPLPRVRRQIAMWATEKQLNKIMARSICSGLMSSGLHGAGPRGPSPYGQVLTEHKEKAGVAIASHESSIGQPKISPTGASAQPARASCPNPSPDRMNGRSADRAARVFHRTPRSATPSSERNRRLSRRRSGPAGNHRSHFAADYFPAVEWLSQSSKRVEARCASSPGTSVRSFSSAPK